MTNQDSWKRFDAQLLDWSEIHELPGGWPAEQLVALLDSLEVDGVTADEAPEMALLALQDCRPAHAAELVLDVVFGDTMRPGIRKNLAQELTEERPWEDFAEISQQAGIFNAVALLQQALPREFDKPDAVSATIRIDTKSATARRWLDAPSPPAALLLRILAAGMGERAILRRLFSDALRGTRFDEADAILWQISRDEARDFVVVSSHQWLSALEDLDSWTAMAWPDDG